MFGDGKQQRPWKTTEDIPRARPSAKHVVPSLSHFILKANREQWKLFLVPLTYAGTEAETG